MAVSESSAHFVSHLRMVAQSVGAWYICLHLKLADRTRTTPETHTEERDYTADYTRIHNRLDTEINANAAIRTLQGILKGICIVQRMEFYFWETQ